MDLSDGWSSWTTAEDRPTAPDEVRNDRGVIDAYLGVAPFSTR